jgi:hypothetical protein
MTRRSLDEFSCPKTSTLIALVRVSCYAPLAGGKDGERKRGATEQTLARLNQEYVDAFMNADVDWYRKHLADEFVVIDANVDFVQCAVRHGIFVVGSIL